MLRHGHKYPGVKRSKCREETRGRWDWVQPKDGRHSEEELTLNPSFCPILCWADNVKCFLYFSLKSCGLNTVIYPHFTKADTEIQQGSVMCLRHPANEWQKENSRVTSRSEPPCYSRWLCYERHGCVDVAVCVCIWTQYIYTMHLVHMYWMCIFTCWVWHRQKTVIRESMSDVREGFSITRRLVGMGVRSGLWGHFTE